LRHRVSAIVVAIVVACSAVLSSAGPASAAPTGPEAPILYADSPNAVPGRYIVVFKDAAVAATAVGRKARDLTGRFGGQTRHLYTAGPRGFSVALPAPGGCVPAASSSTSPG